MTDHDLTPTYADLVHYADLGRRLTQAAGIATETHPTADVVLQALQEKAYLNYYMLCMWHNLPTSAQAGEVETAIMRKAYARVIIDLEIAVSDLSKKYKEPRNVEAL